MTAADGNAHRTVIELVRRELATLFETLSVAREGWGGDGSLAAACHALSAVVKFLQALDVADLDGRRLPLDGLLSAILTLEEHGTVVSLLLPAAPSRGQPPLSVPERATRFIAVAIADTLAQSTGMPRKKADDIVAKKADELGPFFGSNPGSAATKLKPAKRLAAHRKRLGRLSGKKMLSDEERRAYHDHQVMLLEKVGGWRAAQGVTSHEEVKRRLLKILEDELAGRLPVLGRGEGTEEPF